MKKIHRTGVLAGAMGILYVLHSDWWFWHNPQLIFGLPVGLFYHLLLCMVSGLLLFTLVHPGRDSGSDSDTTK